MSDAVLIACLCPFCARSRDGDALVSPGPRAEGHPFGGGDHFDLLNYSYRPATPSGAEVDVVQRLRGFVMALLGASLPRSETEWFWTADPTLPTGFCTAPRQAGPLVVCLRVGLPHRELVAAALHELWHTVDHRRVDLGVQQLEARAATFAKRWTDRACQQLGILGQAARPEVEEPIGDTS